MRKIKLLLLLSLASGMVIFAAILVPYLLYTKTLHQGIEGKYLSIKGLSRSAHSGEAFVFPDVKMENMDLWKNFHFSNFIIPLPLHHPQILVIPVIDEYFENNFLSFGVKLTNTDVEEYASFVIEKPKNLKWNDFKGELFQLPIATKIINSKTIVEIWEDLFTRDLNVFFKKNMLSMPYSELMYNLFIQALRLKYFPENVINVSFIKDRKIGVVELSTNDERYRSEVVYALNNDLIYTLKFQSRKWTVFAETIRKRFFLNFNFKGDDETAAALIYSEYKSLSFEEKIDQEGMTYLYSAWSHVPASKDFLREMIQFLERGKNNIHHLNSLYRYGYKRFGSSFSLKEERLQEKASEKLERKIKEELEAEIKKEEKEKVQQADGKFENEQERTRFLLQKAKDSGKNADENDDMISN